MHQLRLLFFLLPAFLPAQDFFERYYDSGGAENGSAIAIAGNNLVLAGRTDFNAIDRTNGVLHALDLNGNLRYTATIAADHRTNFTALTTVQLSGSPGIIAGAWANVEQTSDNLTFYGLNIAGEGNAFGWGDAVDDEQARSLLTLANGDVLAVGNVGNTNNGLIFRFTPEGTVRWRRTFAIPGTRFNVFHQAREVPGAIFVVGYSTVEEADGQTILLKLTPEGELLWSYRYDYRNEADARFRTLQVLPNGELIITSHVQNGEGTADILFLRLSSDGEVVSKSLLGGASRNGVQATLQTPRSTLLLAGASSISVLRQTTTAMVLEVDRDGQILRQRTLAITANSRINAMVVAPGGGYFLAGTADFCAGETDMLLAYLDENLENPLDFCGYTPINLSRKPAGAITRVAIGSLAERNEPQVVPFALEARPVVINDRNCPQLDLDADDSSGAAEPNGFTFPDTCYNGPLPIMDVDAAFSVGQPLLTSVRISFTQLQEGESLDFPLEMVGQVESVGPNDYNFVNAQNLTTDQVLALLKRIRYRNDNERIVEGIREIRVLTNFLCQSSLAITRFNLLASGRFEPNLPDTVLCPGEELFVDATAAGATNYVWGDGAQDARRSIEEPGTYVVTLSNACSATVDTLVVTAGQALGQLPQFRDQALCPGDSVSLDATTAGAFAYQWSDGTTLPDRTFDTPGDYALTISSGCREEVLAFTLYGQSCCQLYLPNAFSPNGDGINDVFRAFPDPELCAPVTDYQLRIFNRWGGEVYAGEILTAGWDGTVAGRPAEAGHYVYTISYQDGFQKVQRSGGVVLLR